MKIFYAILLFSITAANAAELLECVDAQSPMAGSSLEQLDSSLTRVNCHTSLNFMIDKDALSESDMEICGSCRSKFLLQIEPYLSTYDPQRLESAKKKSYVQILFKELQKSISATLMDAVAQRNLQKTSSDYPLSTKACNTTSFVQRVESCKGLDDTDVQISKLSGLIAGQLAGVLSLEEAAPTRSCSENQNISSAETARLLAYSIEELISPSMIQKISSIPEKLNTRSLELSLKSVLTEEEYTLMVDMRYHPIFSSLRTDPEKFINFFKNVPFSLDQKTLTNNLRSSLYTRQNGDILDKELAKRCSSAFNTFQKVVCSSEFDAKEINQSPFSNYSKMLDQDEFDDSATEASNESVKKRNFNLLTFCPSENNSNGKFSLEKDLNSISSWMQEDDQQYPLSQYKLARIKQQVTDPKSRICDETCTPTTQTIPCKMRDLIRQNSATPETRQRFLAGAADPGINNILRSLVGTPKDISSEAREVLVKEGIIPQENGTYAANNVPTGSPVSNRSPETTSATKSATSVASTQAAQATTSHSPREQYRGQARLAQTPPPAAANNYDEFNADFDQRMSELQNLSQAEERRMQEVRDQITRRLSNSSSSPAREEVARTTRETFHRRNTPLSPQKETQIVNQLMNDFSSEGSSHNFAGSSLPGPATGQGAELGDDLAGPSRAYRQRNEALAGMAGAKGSRVASGSTGSASLNRTPAGSADQETSNSLPTVAVYVRGSDIGINLEVMITQQLENQISENFNLEIIGSGQDKIQYKITKGAEDKLQVTLVNDSPLARKYITRVQELVNRLYREKSRTARLTDLRNISSLPSSRN